MSMVLLIYSNIMLIFIINNKYILKFINPLYLILQQVYLFRIQFNHIYKKIKIKK